MVTIYGIRNITSKQTYVGCTAGKVNKRMREHRCLLNASKHSAKGLQADWSAIGEQSFELVTLQTLPDGASLEEKRQAELKWMRSLQATGLLYNAHVVSYSGTADSLRKAMDASRDVPGNRWTPETNEKRRLAQLGKPKGHGAKISATKRAKNAMR